MNLNLNVEQLSDTIKAYLLWPNTAPIKQHNNSVVYVSVLENPLDAEVMSHAS